MAAFFDFLVSLLSQFKDYCQTAFIDATFRGFNSSFMGW